MAEQNEIRKTLRILFKGTRYYVRSGHKEYDQSFTTYDKAEEFLERKYREKKEKYIRKLMREMMKIEDLGKRFRRYKQICRIKSQL